MTYARIKKSVVMAAALAGWAALAVSCGSSSGYSTNPSPTPTPTSGGGNSTADVMVEIMGMNGANSFSPNPATVKAGQTVAWHNSDMIVHTATGAGFDTGVISPGTTSAPIRFSSAGTFSYRCSIHPSMTGTLNVTP